jgi:hypothetical protein
MAITNGAWDGSASRWPDADSFCEACLIDENEPGKPKVKTLCKLPVKEPNGDTNANAAHAAAAALAGGRGGVQAKPQSKKAAARKLKTIYAEMKEPLPLSIKAML